MSVATAVRPAADEHVEYYGKYIKLVQESDAISALRLELEDTLATLHAIPETQGDHRYAPGKWSIRQVVAHLIDAERVFAYRALRFARADETPVPGFDETTYAESAGADQRTLRSLVDEYESLRRADIAMFEGLPEAAWVRRGSANGNAISVRALAFIIAGHGRHHAGLLRERYLTR
jgi:DinB superfamily